MIHLDHMKLKVPVIIFEGINTFAVVYICIIQSALESILLFLINIISIDFINYK